MTREDIRNAAMEFAYKTGETDFNAFSKGFFNGVRWRINSVWHTVDEIPCALEEVLIETLDGMYYADMFPKQIDAPIKGLRRWAYIEDLLPDRKEVTK